jgi:hypothetical protein
MTSLTYFRVSCYEVLTTSKQIFCKICFRIKVDRRFEIPQFVAGYPTSSTGKQRNVSRKYTVIAICLLLVIDLYVTLHHSLSRCMK